MTDWLFIYLGPFWISSRLPQTHYLFEVPRQARVSHLVRCISRSPCACGDLLGFTVEEMVSPLSVGLPCGFAFRPLRPWLHCSPVNSPSCGTSGVISMASSEGYSEDSFGALGKTLLGPFCCDEISKSRSPVSLLAAYAGMSGLSPAPQRLLFSPRHDIWHSISCLRGAMRHFHSCRRLPDPRLAAFRLNFWASAAGLYVGLGTFTVRRLSHAS
ncbi:hypothetical protein EDB86DRAFT_1775230 [Lactarius hatsudake]|nr:hypothetical protein EDB86DRAFT_1775230 [Lactarius hatsudake]